MSGILLAMAGMSGAAPGVVSIGNESITGVGVGQAIINYENDGDLTGTGTGAPSSTWVNPHTTTVAAFYQIFASATGDTATLTGAALDTWLDLSSTRSWTLSAPGAPGSAVVSLAVQIREKATTIVRDTATVTLNTNTP